MEMITNFGNAILLIALSLFVGVRLGVSGRAASALIWVVAVLALIGSMTCIKVYFFACHLSPLGIHNPSGHVAFSLTVYGGIGIILYVGREKAHWRLAAALVAAWVVAIAVSRVVLHDHTVLEVIAGAGVGGAVLAAFAAAYLRARPAKITPNLLDLAAAAVILALTHGYQMGIEDFLHGLGGALHHHHIFCL